MAKLATTGYTADTSKHYWIDAGVIYTDVTYTEATGFEGNPAGATSDGVELNIEMKYRDVEVDGTGWTPVKGNKVLSSAIATAKANIKELTAETVRQALNGAKEAAKTTEAPEGYTKITGKRQISDGDYLKNVAIVGKISGSTQPIIVILDNALVTSGVSAKTKDDDEVVIEQEYTAHASYEQLVAQEFPWRIYLPPVDIDTVETD